MLNDACTTANHQSNDEARRVDKLQIIPKWVPDMSHLDATDPSDTWLKDFAETQRRLEIRRKKLLQILKDAQLKSLDRTATAQQALACRDKLQQELTVARCCLDAEAQALRAAFPRFKAAAVSPLIVPSEPAPLSLSRAEEIAQLARGVPTTATMRKTSTISK